MSYVANLSHYSVPGPHGFKAMDVRDIGLHGIDVGERQRPIDQKKVEELARSIMEHGQKQPIGVRAKKVHGFELIFGAHRLEAMKFIERQGWDDRASIWATIYPEDYPEIRIQMDELVENLHRNELIPAEKAAHQTTYAGLLKKNHKIVAAEQKRKDNAKNQYNKEANAAIQNNMGDQRPLVHPKSNGQTITEKLAADLGVTDETVRNRHRTAQKLAARVGTTIPSLEKATAEELIEGGKAALLAAEEKREKAQKTGKPESRVDAIEPQKPTISQLKLDVVDLPNQLCDWARRRYGEHRLSLEVMKATHQKWGELIEEFSQATAK